MIQLTIRNVEDSVRLKLKTRAAAKGRSLEAELREILTQAAAETVPPANIGRAILNRFRDVGGVDLDIPSRTPERAIPNFE